MKIRGSNRMPKIMFFDIDEFRDNENQVHYFNRIKEAVKEANELDLDLEPKNFWYRRPDTLEGIEKWVEGKNLEAIWDDDVCFETVVLAKQGSKYHFLERLGIYAKLHLDGWKLHTEDGCGEQTYKYFEELLPDALSLIKKFREFDSSFPHMYNDILAKISFAKYTEDGKEKEIWIEPRFTGFVYKTTENQLETTPYDWNTVVEIGKTEIEELIKRNIDVRDIYVNLNYKGK